MQRNLQPELLDDPGMDPGLHEGALAGLRRLNAISGTAGYLWKTLRRVAQRRGRTHLRVLDVACGDGELAMALARRSGRGGLDVTVDGFDRNPLSVQRAADLARDKGVKHCSFFVHDALEQAAPPGYDVLYSTLFLHHLDEDQAVKLMRRMGAQAQCAVIIDDLARSRWGYALAWAGCHLLSRSPIVHHDGPVSVQGAYTAEEAAAVARRAGAGNLQVSRHWPQRFQLCWEPECSTKPSKSPPPVMAAGTSSS